MIFKLRLFVLIGLLIASTASLHADDDDDFDDNDFDDDIVDIIEKEKEREEEEAEERAEEQAEQLLENFLEQRVGDNVEFDDDFEDELEDWLEDQLEANSSGDDLEERMEEELEKHLESLVDDDDQTEDQLEFLDDKLQQLWQFEDDLEESLLPPLPNQLIALVSAEQLAAAKAQGAIILNEEALSELGAVLVTFDSSQPVPIDQAAIEQNDVYQLDALNNSSKALSPLHQANIMGVQSPLMAQQKVGLMDSSIDINHNCFAGNRIAQKNFHDTSLQTYQPSYQHGTAMASILMGDNACDAQGLLTQAELFNAVVFAQSASGAVVASAAQLISGLNWLLSQQVSIINMSLSGPPNKILQQALTQVAARGVTLVASAGNDGGAAFPRFPAAYPEVIAVTAVDQQLNVFTRAAQGPHIEIAAPGVDVLIARDQGYASLSGTSLAAVMITAVLASEKAVPNKPDLSLRAKPISGSERNEMYGFGLMQK